MSRIRTNTLALGSSFFVTAVLAFLQVKIITNFLGQEAVGVWSAVLAVGALLGTLSELGLPQVLVRYGAKYDAEGRLARLGKLLFFSLRIYLVALVLVTAVLILIGPWVSRLLGGTEASVLGRRLLVIGYLAVASGSARAINNASFRGIRRMVIVAVLEITFSVVVTGGYFLMRHRLSVELALVVFLAASVAVALLGLGALVRYLRPIRAQAGPGVFAGPVLPEVKGYWQGAAAAGIFLIAIEQLDKPLLATLVSFEALAIFHVAARLALFARRLLYIPFQVMNPEITHKWEGPRRPELRRDMELFIKLELGLGLMLLAFLTIFARPLLLLVSTPKFLPGAPVLWMFTLVVPVLCLNQPLVLFLRAIGHVWYAFGNDSAWLVIYLGAGSLMVRRFGLPGFVSGQALASVVVLTYTLIVFHRLRLPRPPVGFFLKRASLSIAVWAVCVTAGRHLPLWPWWAYVLVAGGVAAAANFLLVRGGFLTRVEEERALAMFAGRGPVGRAAQMVLAWPRASLRRTVFGSGRRR